MLFYTRDERLFRRRAQVRIESVIRQVKLGAVTNLSKPVLSARIIGSFAKRQVLFLLAVETFSQS